MGLEEYRRKRDFKKTPEPAGKRRPKRKAQAPLRFVLQKHAARRLHYDFRLELDGVMKSWAVPKGPSLDPRERRLAVHTEDHPIEYNTFEGVIPEGEYGGGTVLLWDRGSWEPHQDDPAEAYAQGSLKFALAGEKLRGNWALVRMGKAAKDGNRENWLLIKERDGTAEPGSGSRIVDDNPRSVATGRDLDEVAADRDRVWHSNRTDGASAQDAALRPDRLARAQRAALPQALAPQLATLAKAAPRGEDWLHEIKFDGYRILCRIERGSAKLISRNGLDWTERFPELAGAAARLPAETALLDGEVVALAADGTSSFPALQEALSKGQTGALVYYAFDLVHLDGWSLMECRLEDRKTLLAELLQATADPMRYSDHQIGLGPEFHRNACGLGLEGIVSKRREAGYCPGRNRAWLKLKCVNRDELVVVGYTDPAGARIGFGALALGYYDEAGALRYAGRVGTGFDDRLLADLAARLKRLPQVDRPFRKLPPGAATGAHWTAPRLVAQVQYTGWTRDGVLRHPVFLGLREDKPAREVVLEPKAVATAAPARPGGKATPEIAGVRLSNPDKLLYPGTGITKLDLARYYEAVAEPALAHLAHRPLTLLRCPDGEGGDCFFQKHVGNGVPSGIGTVRIKEKEDGTGTYLAVEDLRGLVSLVQMGVLEIHPWGSTVGDIEHPDRLIFDLDPDAGLGWERVVEAAFELKGVLAAIGLESFAKTTGGKGLHVVVPIRPHLDWDTAKAFTKAVVEAMAEAAPGRYTTNMAKRARHGRIFLDYLRNGRGATAVGAFSSRARTGAPVSVPVAWTEIEAGVRSDQFTVPTVPERMAGLARDPWSGFFGSRQTIPDKALRKLRP